MPSHGLTSANTITIDEDGFTFTCDMNQNEDTHTYPRKGDPAFGKSLAITAYTLSTITVNVGTTPLVKYNVSGADYNPVTGALNMTIGAHQLVTGQSFRFKKEALTFTCDRDDYVSEHSYPRDTDPVYNTSVEITEVSQTSHTPTGATYDPNTGIVNFTLSGHPFTGQSTDTVENAAYNPETGIMTLTCTNHGFSVGDSIKLADNSLTFTLSLIHI